MSSLIYASEFAKEKFPLSELAKIHKISKNKNQKSDISGILVFGDNYFLQCIEGERTALNALYAKILNDKRHKNVLLLCCNDITERQFSQWSMKHVLISEDKRQLVRKYSATSDFNPFLMSSTSARDFLLSLR